NRLVGRCPRCKHLLALRDHLEHLATCRAVAGDGLLIGFELERLVDCKLARASVLGNGQHSVKNDVERRAGPGLFFGWTSLGVAASALDELAARRRSLMPDRLSAAAQAASLRISSSGVPPVIATQRATATS